MSQANTLTNYIPAIQAGTATDVFVVQDQINEHEKALRKKQEALARAREEAADAQALIDEATEINSHPEITQRIANTLTADKRERAQLVRELGELESREKSVREITHESRRKFRLAILAVVAIVIIVVSIWLLLAGR